MKTDQTTIIIPKKKSMPIEVGQQVSDTQTIKSIDVTDNATYVEVTDGESSLIYGAKVFLEKFRS